MYTPLCGGTEGATYNCDHGASLSPKRPTHDRRDWGVSAAVWGDGEGNERLLPRRVSIPLKAQAGAEGLRCIRRYVGGRRGQRTIATTGRPYPLNGPRRTGGPRVCPPLCGEEM